LHRIYKDLKVKGMDDKRNCHTDTCHQIYTLLILNGNLDMKISLSIIFTSFSSVKLITLKKPKLFFIDSKFIAKAHIDSLWKIARLELGHQFYGLNENHNKDYDVTKYLTPSNIVPIDHLNLMCIIIGVTKL
jgi:hypothetical protein